ncbi:hypothetical protein SY2F82_11140 [Streptomyces sp. Y2F8-2]|nr:hypothetical protein SY2F82_11140 [Streptomyces sp. Y2F8-2]
MFSARMFRFTPATIAASASPPRRLSQARCTATREDDWAVSTVRLGPCRSRKYETRLAMIPRFRPVMVCWVTASVPLW